MDRKTIGIGLLIAAISLAAEGARAQSRQFVKGHLPAAFSLQSVGRVPGTNRLDIAFDLPLRNRHSLTNLLRELYRPGSPSYRHYLKPDEFAAKFGPTDSDYQAVIQFAQAHHLTVTRTHSNRTLLDVNGAVADIEEAFHVHMNFYRHPMEDRNFYAPDAQPSMDLATPVLLIDGLHNDTLPRPKAHPVQSQSGTGSGAGGSYLGMDFRSAYMPGVSVIGTGQTVGLFEVDGFKISDITNYETMSHLTNFVPVTSNLIDGFSGAPSGSLVTVEVCLDIEMAIAMAPGLSGVVVYEGQSSAPTVVNDILNCMATNDAASQLSASYTYDINNGTDQIFEQFAAQGQSFFNASGDTNAYAGPVEEPTDDPNITVVGGTELTTTGPLGPWEQETVWGGNKGEYGSSGGISLVIPIPWWQQGVNMSANGGSTNFRNMPDVAMVADNVLVAENGSTGVYGGTSCATPMWAGVAALANQLAASIGQPPIGFINPLVYAIGKGGSYSNCFHDIVSGNNFSAGNPTNYVATAGYDLCTGWGTPTGTNLLAALLGTADPLVITPPVEVTVVGPVGGPFTHAPQNYLLTNAGNSPLNWTLANGAPWLTVSPAGGSLAPGAETTVSVSPNSTASNLLLGDYTAALSFTDLQDNFTQTWPVSLFAGNGGFETGDFTDWTFSGEADADTVVCLDDSQFEGDAWAGVSYEEFVHSGLCAAFLGQYTTNGYLSQSLPTVPSQYYLLSCWLQSFADTNGNVAPNDFSITWNGATLFSQTNIPATGWTNLQYIVSATSNATTLEFTFRDDPAAFALDEITMQLVPTPEFQTVTASGGSVFFTWNALAGLSYQLEYTTNLAQTNWMDVGPLIVASTNVVTTSDTHPPDEQRFYRFVVSP